MYVCMYVCLLAYLKTLVCISRNFLYMLPVAVARSIFDDKAIGYVLPVLWMTSCFHILGHMEYESMHMPSNNLCGFTHFRVFELRTRWRSLLPSTALS